MQCTIATVSVAGGTIYDILTTTSSVDRRVYGLNVTSTDNAANPVKIYLSDGTSTLQVSNVNVVANSGNSTATALTNVFTSTMGESVFCKTRDANGLPYFNVPKNWSMKISFATTPGVGETIYTFVYGEYY
jgi:hypothetical protein